MRSRSAREKAIFSAVRMLADLGDRPPAFLKPAKSFKLQSLPR